MGERKAEPGAGLTIIPTLRIMAAHIAGLSDQIIARKLMANVVDEWVLV
jgi:hypothetical protein